MVTVCKENRVKVLLVHVVLQLYLVKCQEPPHRSRTELEMTETALKINNRHLASIPEGNPQVKTLDLSYNSLAELPQYVFQKNNYTNLEKAHLNNNFISNITSSAFWGLTTITEIDLASNNLSTIDSYAFKYNPNLMTLVLARNKIKFNKFQPFLISKSLEYLTLSDNKIDQIYDVSFVMLPNLRSLSLSQNKLTVLSGNCFKGLVNLRYLHLVETLVDRLVLDMFSERNSLRMLSLDKTPLANNFDPPLGKIRGDSIRQLLLLLSMQ